jgi:hypothetical protein
VVRSAGDEAVQYGGVQVGRKTAHAPGVFLAVFSSVGSRCKGPSPIRRARRGSARRQVLTGARSPPLRAAGHGVRGTLCEQQVRERAEPLPAGRVRHPRRTRRHAVPATSRWLTAHDRPRGWEGAPALSERDAIYSESRHDVANCDAIYSESRHDVAKRDAIYSESRHDVANCDAFYSESRARRWGR